MKKITTFGFLILIGFSFFCHTLHKPNNRIGVKRYFFLIKTDSYSIEQEKTLHFFDTTFITKFTNKTVLIRNIQGSDFKVVPNDSILILSDSGQPLYYKPEYTLKKQGEPLADWYSMDDTINPVKVNADSMWNKHITFPPLLIDEKIDSLVATKENRKERTEYYVAPRLPDESFPDSIILKYSANLNDMPLSISKELDMRNGKKLYRAEFIYKSYYDERYKQQIPRRVYIFEVNKVGEEKDRFVRKLLGI